MNIFLHLILNCTLRFWVFYFKPFGQCSNRVCKIVYTYVHIAWSESVWYNTPWLVPISRIVHDRGSVRNFIGITNYVSYILCLNITFLSYSTNFYMYMHALSYSSVLFFICPFKVVSYLYSMIRILISVRISRTIIMPDYNCIYVVCLRYFRSNIWTWNL